MTEKLITDQRDLDALALAYIHGGIHTIVNFPT